MVDDPAYVWLYSIYGKEIAEHMYNSMLQDKGHDGKDEDEDEDLVPA